MYLLKLALRPWRTALLSQIFSALAVGFLLFLVGFLFWMQQGLKPILTRLQGEQVVTAYLESSVDPKDESRLMDSVRAALGTHPSIEAHFVTAPQFLNVLKKQYPELARELEDLGADIQQVVPRYISVSGILPRFAVERLSEIPGVESVESSKDRYQHTVGAFAATQWVIRALIVGVCFALFTGLIHLSRMNAYLHQDVLSLLRFWGAGKSTLLIPGMVSGLWVGLLGGAMAMIAWVGIGTRLAQQIRSLSSLLKSMPMVYFHQALLLLFLGAVIGLVAGMLGSLAECD